MTNPIEFYTPKREYKIVVYRLEKQYAISEFGKYDCHIDFYDTILNRLVLSLVGTEKEILNLYTTFNEFLDYLLYDSMSIIDTIIPIGQNNFIHFGSYVINNPTDDDEDDFGLILNIYETSINGNKMRISFHCDFNYITQIFLPYIFEIIRTIKNSDELYENYIEDNKFIVY